ncbi:pimeloyl-ACP methyl ester esterase BioH [Marinicella sp. W31]|uniref:pimeloyl-ACP methyl ester esterase BioH n=1 Tax=Marinicella sp. W31 TaxID=3023713 RepID=UPI003757C27C
MKIIETLGCAQSPVLYMLHGWGVHSALLKPLAEQLSADYQVHLLDLPGHGFNQNQQLSADLTACAQLADDFEPGIWLGWSLGGMLAMNLALNKPHLVQKLVLLCATPCFTQKEHWPHGVESSVLDQFGERIQEDIKQTIRRFLQLEVLGSGDEKDQLKKITQQVFQAPLPDIVSLQAGLQLLRHADLSLSLKNLQMPSLWLTGRRDRMVRPAAVQMASEYSQGKYQMIRGAGHAPFIHHSDELTEIIREFLCH